MKKAEFSLFYVGFFVMLVGIYAVSWLIQSSVLMGWDVSWGLHEAKRLLAGRDYFYDFYEMTPPMFLYLYIPTVLLSHIFTLDMALCSSFFFFAGCSLWICWGLIQKIFVQSDYKIALFFLLAIANAFLLLPLAVDFGQREHMLILCILPYILLISLRIEKKVISFYYAVFIGLLAGIGFAIKPFFLLTLILLELYCSLSTRCWFRAETITIFAIFVVYAISTYFFYPNYFHIILPLATRTYYQGINNSFLELIKLPTFIYGIFIALFYAMTFKKMPYRALTICLLLALSGFSASYLLQHTNWYYHDLPAYSVATILGFLLWALSVQYGHFSSLPRMILFAVVSIIVLIYPVHTILRGYVFAKNYQRAINPLLAFLNNHAQHKTVYFFSTSMHYEFPAVDYSHSIPASRYPLLIWVSGYQRQLQEKMSEAKQKKLALDNDFFMQTLLSEIHANQPNYIFVETSEHKQYLTGIPYDYLQDFLRYSTFKKIWQDYRYLTTIDHSPQYRFAIYQRRDNA